jgi:hypothetical protein
MMMKKTCLAVLWLSSIALLMMAASPIVAQVPQDTTFTGRLVNDSGSPIAGPVDLELRVFDSETSGTQLFSEEHLGVPIDSDGGFAVQLGLGTSPSGSFDADLFSDVDRWLEVLVGTEVLTPRQIIGSVPWALVAERVAPPPSDPNITPRFEDCGDGTVADHKTGLQWEKKTGTLVGPVNCDTVPCPDSHDVNNRYHWSLDSLYGPNGGAFTDFLTSLNSGVVVTTSAEALGDPAVEPKPFGSDWRLPTIGELRTIMIGPQAAPGQPLTCSAAPCIDPGFAAVGGPTASFYWSASNYADDSHVAWGALFGDGVAALGSKVSGVGYVRAVRAGWCN